MYSANWNRFCRLNRFCRRRDVEYGSSGFGYKSEHCQNKYKQSNKNTMRVGRTHIKTSVDARIIDTGMMVWSQTYGNDNFEALDKQWQIKLLSKIHLIYFDLNILLVYHRKVVYNFIGHDKRTYRYNVKIRSNVSEVRFVHSKISASINNFARHYMNTFIVVLIKMLSAVAQRDLLG